VTAPAPLLWLAKRWRPVLATIGLVLYGLASSTWWGPALVGKTAWALPDDLWGTLTAAQRALHLDWSGLYTQPTGLVTLPGWALVLVPVVAVLDALRIPLTLPGPHNAHPTAWLVAGPYEIAISCSVLFAADAVAVRLGVRGSDRLLLTIGEVVALWSVAVQWGHPEDAVAVALYLYALLALTGGRRLTGRAGWLAGAAVAVQPLVLLALPVVLVVVAPKRIAGFLARSAAPGVVLLAIAAVANWGATFEAVVHQPNQPAVNHPTPWTFLTPAAGHGAVVAGPSRALAIVVAAGCAALYLRERPRAGAGGHLAGLLWWTALALAVRSFFEPVMVPYYLWPPLAVALLAAARDRRRLVACGVGTTSLTFLSLIKSQNPWNWWAPVLAGLAVTLVLARTAGRSGEPGDVPVQDHVADEGHRVDQAVGDHEPEQAPSPLPHATEEQAHGGVPEEAAEPLVEVVGAAEQRGADQRPVVAPVQLPEAVE
jgi:hypothetical protein